MSNYSKFSEEKKRKSREASARWAAKSKEARKKYYKEYEKDRNTSLQNRLYRSSKQRARNENIPHTISREDIPINATCPICEREMKVSSTIGGSSTSPTLDKIIPSLGYIKENIDVICKGCNSRKGNSTLEDLLKIVNYLQKHISKSPSS